MSVIADTGPLYALIDSSDVWHERVVEWWRNNADEILVPVCVLPEVCYLLHQRISHAAESAFVRAIANGDFAVEPLETEDVIRADQLMSKYSDLGIGFVDATVVALAERLDVTDILTTDRRHFGVVKPRHVAALTLRP